MRRKNTKNTSITRKKRDAIGCRRKTDAKAEEDEYQKILKITASRMRK